MNRLSSSNQTILQGNTTIDPVDPWVDALKPIKTANYILVQLLYNPDLRMHFITNLICIV